jgi:hypothetical protein
VEWLISSFLQHARELDHPPLAAFVQWMGVELELPAEGYVDVMRA